MDRLRALVGLRWRLELRAMRWAPERALGLALAVPALLLFSAFATVAVFVGTRALAASDPGLLLPVGSLLATVVGVFWLLSPLITGVALSETHDVSRVLHFPVAPATLVAASLAANLAQPAVLAKMPIVLGVAVGAADRLSQWPLTLLGVGLTFAFILAADQLLTLLMHGLSRNRRVRDVALFTGLALGFALSLLPLLFFSAGAPPLRALRGLVIDGDLLALSPFAWGVRAALHAGRGDTAGFLGWGVAGVAAVGVALAASAALLRRLYRGELDLGGAVEAGRGAPARMPLPGALGALVEKDLRMAWRDPALKATLLVGMAGPLLFLFFILQARGPGGVGRGLFLLAAFVGAASFGGNAFGLERRGIALLMSLPVDRWRILVAKNLTGLALRLPGLMVVVVAGLVVAPVYLPAALTAALCGAMLAAAGDNYFSVLFPVAVPEPGKTLSGGAGRRGLGAAALGAMMFAASLALAAPFLLLAWLPVLFETPLLWLGSLPLALAGAASVYAMLVAGAARLLERREAEVLERILASAGDA